jgi:hypothetical protein
LTDERQQTAVRSTPMVEAGVQHDLRAQVRLAHLEAELLLVSRHRVVHGVGEEQVGLAGLQAELEDFLPELAGVDLFHDFAGLRRRSWNGASGDGLHELVGDVDAVVEVQRLAVEVARGFADFEELLDLRVVDVEIAPPPSRGAASPG